MSGYNDIDYAGETDVGVRRSHNQDAHALLPATDEEQWRGRGHVFLVADGMGAHAVGELASKLAADSIPHLYSKHAAEGPAAALRKAFVETNLTIHTRGQQNREFEGMGTTGTALLLRPEGAWIAHVGDSRVYRVRAGLIEQLSFDHSLVWELARRQHKNPEELQGIPSNVIVRSLGPEPLVQVDIEGPHPVQAGDYFVLCSDGLSGPVPDKDIGAVVSVLPPAEACRFLVHLANLQGGPDNITAIVVRAGDGQGGDSGAPGETKLPGPPRSTWRFLGQIPWPFWPLILGIVLAGTAIFLTSRGGQGGLPTFLVAAGALVAGLLGLILHSLREKTREAAETPASKLKIYRQVPCTVDHALLDKMAQALTSIDEQIRAHHWEADWDACRQHLEEAERFRELGDLTAAFREQCRGLLLLMEAFHKQRGKEEVFKPMWDTVAE